jgi:hypothetical protein
MKEYIRIRTGDYDVELLIESEAALKAAKKVFQQFVKDCQEDILLTNRWKDIQVGLEGKTEKELDDYLREKGVRIDE